MGGRHAIVTDTHVTPANVDDSIFYLERLDRQRQRFDLNVGTVGRLLASCTSNAKAQRAIIRHVWADARERNDANRKTAKGKAIYKRRKETVERSFADAKRLTDTTMRASWG